MIVPARQSMHDAVCDVITSQTRAVKNVTRISNYIEGGGGGTMRINRWVCFHHISYVHIILYRHLTYIGPTIIESIHRDILLKILFLTITVQKCILNRKQNNIYYGVLT